jgi:hypothetical protein
MKPGAIMKSMFAGLLVFCALAVWAGAARADDWKLVGSGSMSVDVYVKKDPSVTSGMRNVQIRFVNHNDYNVSITYTIIIRCAGDSSKDADNGTVNIRNHSENSTSFSYAVCEGEDTDDVSMLEVRIKDVKKT